MKSGMTETTRRTLLHAATALKEEAHDRDVQAKRVGNQNGDMPSDATAFRARARELRSLAKDVEELIARLG